MIGQMKDLFCLSELVFSVTRFLAIRERGQRSPALTITASHSLLQHYKEHYMNFTVFIPLILCNNLVAASLHEGNTIPLNSRASLVTAWQKPQGDTQSCNSYKDK